MNVRVVWLLVQLINNKMRYVHFKSPQPTVRYVCPCPLFFLPHKIRQAGEGKLWGETIGRSRNFEGLHQPFFSRFEDLSTLSAIICIESNRIWIVCVESSCKMARCCAVIHGDGISGSLILHQSQEEAPTSIDGQIRGLAPVNNL